MIYQYAKALFALLSKSKTYHEEVEYYYQSSQKDYEIIWGAKEHGSFHYGFWEKGIKSHNQAINNTTEKVAHYGNLKPNLKVADLGCGIGGPAMYLAKKYGIEVDGVSITRKQIAQANKDAQDRGLEKAIFYAEDYCHTSLESDHYDVVYGIESYCHAQNKLDVLKESARLLKESGKLVVLDFFWSFDKLRITEKSDSDREAMTNWAKSWAVSDFAYEKEFEEKLQQAGFTNIQKKVVTKHVEPSIKRLFYIFIPSVAIDWVLRVIGKRKGKHENMWSAYYQYQCWKRGLWNYCIFTAEKA